MRSFLRRSAVAVAAVSLAGAAVTTGLRPADATTAPAWAATSTRAVHLAGTRLGATPDAKPLHLTVTLQPRNAAAMRAAMRAIYTPGSATYHHYLTAAQWRAAYAPTPAAVAQVISYLKGAGLTDVHATANRLAVTATATAAVAEQAFHTSLVSYRHAGATHYGNTSAAQVPAALHPIVSSVIGLNDLPLDAVRPTVVHPSASKPSDAGSPSTDGLFPAQFQTTYDAVGTATGSRTAVAILTEGDVSSVITSLRYAEETEKQAKVPVTVRQVGPTSTDTAGVGEFAMDSQTSTMMAGGVKRLYLYNIGSLADAQVVADIEAFVSDDKASAMSASIGGCEFSAYLDGSELSVDVAMQEGAMQGQSLFASSGDEGDACAFVANTGTPAGVPQVEWPASGEFDTSVGGTSLVSDADGNRIQELAWLGGGGGISEFELPGWWTADTDPVTAAEYVTGGRAVPDVALDADPNVATPVKIYVGKELTYIGGTSLSSPLMLGAWARMESAHANRLGLASIALYRVYDKVNPGVTNTVPAVGLPVTVPTPNPAPVPGFTDIVLGANGTYAATPGWDFTTGLGAPDVKELTKVIG